MLTKEQNEILCRVGPGTPMGEYMRQFWIPVMRAQRLEADGAPVRVRLLGENFVAFRATDGRVGFFDEGCPHRCTSLALARNEDNALTCIFHGWKIDVTGKVVDVPSEPPERRQEFAAKVRVRHYPVREAGTIIWVYLGKNEEAPQFPTFPWIDLPADHIATRIGIVNCNWLAVLEGQLDSAHIGFLHRDSRTLRSQLRQRQPNSQLSLYDTGPRFEFEMKPYGFREAAIRKTPDGQQYLRIREYCVPWYCYIPSPRGVDQNLAIGVPFDDTTSAQWDVRYNLTRPLEPFTDTVDNYGFTRDNDDYAYNIGNADNCWNQDRRAMKEGSWAGMPSTRYEDFAAAVAQGIITDRSREYLGSSDSSIIKARRLLLEAASRFIRGEPAFGTQTMDLKGISPLDIIVPPSENWRGLQ
jgi:phthalate 4,5-dioxygenase oxygenase subunit